MPKINCIHSIYISSSQNGGKEMEGRARLSPVLNSCNALPIDNTTDRHQVQWKGTENKHFAWIVDNRTLHFPRGNSNQTIMYRITSAGSSCCPISEPHCSDSIISMHTQEELHVIPRKGRRDGGTHCGELGLTGNLFSHIEVFFF